MKAMASKELYHRTKTNWLHKWVEQASVRGMIRDAQGITTARLERRHNDLFNK